MIETEGLSHSVLSGSGSKRTLRFLVIGAGSRGNAYAQAVTTATSGVIHAVAEPHEFQRREFGRKYIWGAEGKATEGQEFCDWKDWLKWEVARRERVKQQPEQQSSGPASVGVDGVFICTLDETHVEILQAIAPLQLHILCEKPLAVSLADCLLVYKTLLGSSASPNKIFSIGHVLRYSPHNTLLRKLLLTDRVVGDIVSLEHCEPVGWWHFAHSYVRGNWRRATPNGDGSLLTKSCHDLDFIMWLLSSRPARPNETSPGAPAHYHQPRAISSFGNLTQFRRERKPPCAKDATNCLSCPIERQCNYSAVRIYRDLHLRQNKNTGWPVKIVCPDIEDGIDDPAQDNKQLTNKNDEIMAKAEDRLLARLREDYDRTTMSDETIASRPWYGRCVYDSDNNVCDDQVVTITWDDDIEEPQGDSPRYVHTPAKTAVFHMIAPTEKQCERRGIIYGTHGEMTYDDSDKISVYSFSTRQRKTYEVPTQPEEERRSHGGGDYGLARGFVNAVDAIENQGWEVTVAQDRFVGCTLEEAIRSHAVVFAAEEARREEKIVKWQQWWAEKLAEAGISQQPAGKSA